MKPSSAQQIAQQHVRHVEQANQRHIDANPHLIPSVSGYLANAQHAGLNIRRELAKAFPNVPFTVRKDRSPPRMARDPSLVVRWTQWEDDNHLPLTPSPQAVAALVRRFERHDRTPPTSTSSMTEPERLERDAFNAVFGGAEFVTVQPVPPTLAQRVQRERAVLEATLDEARSTPVLNPSHERGPTRPRL